MIRFDKLKIITDLQYISIKKDFHVHSKNGVVLSHKYSIKQPYMLCIIANYQHGELSIEFSGKILKDSYIDLINETNIQKCLEEINKIGVCTLSVPNILQDSEVTKCDVTKDVCHNDLDSIVRYIKQHISNYRKWIPKEKHNGIVIENSADTPRFRKRITLYDKEHELNLATNRAFLCELSDKKALLDYFKGKIRIELNINTEAQIRNLLNIQNNSLQEVMASKADPLVAVISEALKEEESAPYVNNLMDHLRLLLLTECDFNLAKVEATVRSLSSRTTAISRAMKPFRQLHDKMRHSTFSLSELQRLVSMA